MMGSSQYRLKLFYHRQHPPPNHRFNTSAQELRQCDIDMELLGK